MESKRRRIAVALRYEEQMDCPILLGLGREAVADEMMRTALRYGIPVLDKGNLALELAHGQIAAEIAEKHYEAVAEAIAESSFKRQNPNDHAERSSRCVSSGEPWTSDRIPRAIPRE